MNIPTNNGMGIESKGIAWKPNYGMGLKKTNGMGLKPSNGMGISKDQNYFKFNEYERKRKYLQMGSRKPSVPKPKPEPKPKEQPKPKKQEEKAKPAEVQKPKETTEFNARKKWGAAAAAITAADAFSNKPKKAAKYESKSEKRVSPDSISVSGGNSVGSMKRTMSLFEQLLYV